MAKTLAEINAQNQQAKVDAAVYLAPKIDQADALWGEAITKEWFDRWNALVAELPDGEFRNHCAAVATVIAGLPGFMASQRAQLAPYLPQEQPPAA